MRTRMAQFNLTPDERMDYGVTVSCIEMTSGEQWTFAVGGHAQAALVDAVSHIDARDGDWRILSISTPVSIRRDLDGARVPLRHTGSGDANGAITQSVTYPESTMLNRIQRLDLLHPSLEGSNPQAERRQRTRKPMSPTGRAEA